MTRSITECNTLSLSADMSAMTAALESLTEALPKLRERSPQVVDRLVGLLERGPELFVLDVDRVAAAGASELRMVAKPSRGLEMVVAAARAGNLDLAIVEQAFGHGSHPSVGFLADPTVTESSAGQKLADDEATQNAGE